MPTEAETNPVTTLDAAQGSVLVFDFGSQYAQLIARRVREQEVYCQIVRHDLPASRVKELNPKGIIFSGGPSSVYAKGAPKCDPDVMELGIPILGICYGMQLACEQLGGKVQNTSTREYGRAFCEQLIENDLLVDLPDKFEVWMSHGDYVEEVSSDFVSLARTSSSPFAAVKHVSRPVYGLQFHPEVTHTPQGKQILANFLFQVCKCEKNWKLDDFAQEMIEQIRKRVGKKRVICGLSGGVDSSVTAALIQKAIGDQLSCILVDNGLLRKGEKESVTREFSQHFKTDLHVNEAEDSFLADLAGTVDPQTKRIRIGHRFIECFREEAKEIEDAHFLAQGTLYPDVIESGAAIDGPAETIKSHHNVGGLPAELGLELIEPLRDLFKDEVRRLGTELGLPAEIVWRHPFPGPGLAVRCLGEVTRDRLVILREADHLLIDEIKKAGYYDKTAQCFAVLLPVQSVGVMGDARTYENCIAIRAVNTDDFMTADWSRLPYDLLAQISTRIINEVKGVNRVVYDISSKPPATIEWE
ncbi:GMP synthase [glutamine-hydrolyzing] [Planctomycetales bacterium 10988]|nr:GMP synthase [glutamine-hydrolyzing] [Planctomycetales bacterium 10988]